MSLTATGPSGCRNDALRFCLLCIVMVAGPGPAGSATPTPAPLVKLGGPASIVFAAPRDACDGDDVPDAPSRAFRKADGSVRLFGLHTKNRSLKGSDLDHLAIDCAPSLISHADPDPAAYDDESWITATWTEDGRTIDALVHHEYQASEHPGRCALAEYMPCWFNTVLGARSTDGGVRFVKDDRPVVASAPFRQDVGQGRHRGFFNPSNIFSDGQDAYFLASTTGWEGQASGVCLFRTATPGDPQSWRAYDGKSFTVRYADPYRSAVPAPHPCAPVGPFPAPVGAVVRLRASGDWLAVFQAKADEKFFPVSGFYVAASRDLIAWSDPRLLLPGPTLYDDPCRSGPQLIAYPSILDSRDPSRNFDRAGQHPDLYYTTLAVEGCTVTSRRTLLRRPLVIGAGP